MKIIIHKAWIARLIRFHITLWPFINLIYSKEELIKKRGELGYKKLINHEKIHLKQQFECMVIALIITVPLSFISLWFLLLIPLLFYILYVLNWIINLFKYGKQAYMNISFEREAYENDDNLDYLKTKKLGSWINYFKK